MPVCLYTLYYVYKSDQYSIIQLLSLNHSDLNSKHVRKFYMFFCFSGLWSVYWFIFQRQHCWHKLWWLWIKNLIWRESNRHESRTLSIAYWSADKYLSVDCFKDRPPYKVYWMSWRQRGGLNVYTEIHLIDLQRARPFTVFLRADTLIQWNAPPPNYCLKRSRFFSYDHRRLVISSVFKLYLAF